VVLDLWCVFFFFFLLWFFSQHWTIAPMPSTRHWESTLHSQTRRHWNETMRIVGNERWRYAKYSAMCQPRGTKEHVACIINAVWMVCVGGGLKQRFDQLPCISCPECGTSSSIGSNQKHPNQRRQHSQLWDLPLMRRIPVAQRGTNHHE